MPSRRDSQECGLTRGQPIDVLQGLSISTLSLACNALKVVRCRQIVPGKRKRRVFLHGALEQWNRLRESRPPKSRNSLEIMLHGWKGMRGDSVQTPIRR